MFHTGFWRLVVSLDCSGDFAVKPSFRTMGFNSINMSHYFIFLMKICLRFLLFGFSIRKSRNKRQQSHWKQIKQNRVSFYFNLSKTWRMVQLSISYTSLSDLKLLTPSHLNVTRKKLSFCKLRQHHPQLALRRILSAVNLCWPVTLGLTEHYKHLLLPLLHSDESVICDNRSDTSSH